VSDRTHPLVQSTEGPTGRRASMVGSGLDVWEVIATVHDNEESVEEAASYLRIPIELVQAAVAYYDEHREEIDADIELNEAEYQRGFEAAAAGKHAPAGGEP
jgi:uncharacterized protein (DUF433 family)